MSGGEPINTKDVWIALLGCVEKFEQILAKNIVIALAIARLVNEDMHKFYSKIMDKLNCFWYIYPSIYIIVLKVSPL